MDKPKGASPSRLVIRCQDHPTYRGLTKPRNCVSCKAVHAMRGASIKAKSWHAALDAYVVRWGSA